MNPLFLVGPTAVGKTAVAVELARRLGAEIVSADSMQVYRGLDIGTAKPSPAEQAAVRHHLIDVCEVNEPFDAKQFVDLAAKAITDIRARGKTALVVGGTGLYVRALRQGLFEGPGRDPQLRVRLESMSADQLFQELQRVDAATAGGIDRKNPRRLVRALEVFYTTGKPIRDLQKEWGRKEIPRQARDDSMGVCLDRERQELYARIELRIDQQMAAGWVDEVSGLLDRGLAKNPVAMQAAGYKELTAHVRGERSLEQAIQEIKTRTRQLARRQLTWFRREPGLVWLEMERDEGPEKTAQRVAHLISATVIPDEGNTTP